MGQLLMRLSFLCIRNIVKVTVDLRGFVKRENERPTEIKKKAKKPG